MAPRNSTILQHGINVVTAGGTVRSFFTGVVFRRRASQVSTLHGRYGALVCSYRGSYCYHYDSNSWFLDDVFVAVRTAAIVLPALGRRFRRCSYCY